MEEALEGRKKHKGKGKAEEGEETVDEAAGGTSIFHGKQLRDYQGRSYIDPPTDLKNVPHDAYLHRICHIHLSGLVMITFRFLPKKWLHTWSGHTKAVSTTRFFPKTGHLILSAGMDEKVKVGNKGEYGMHAYFLFRFGMFIIIKNVCVLLWATARQFVMYVGLMTDDAF